jgi:hypothetical protein
MDLGKLDMSQRTRDPESSDEIGCAMPTPALKWDSVGLN